MRIGCPTCNVAVEITHGGFIDEHFNDRKFTVRDTPGGVTHWLTVHLRCPASGATVTDQIKETP